MTTVGYGDKVPRTPLGRLLGLTWMLASMVLIASVTATIASSLTVEQLDRHIAGPGDLHRFSVGTVAGTTGEAYAVEHQLITRRFTGADQAIAALETAEIDALIWDAPLLQAVSREHPQLELVPGVFARQDYAIAVPEGSPLREKINRHLPDKLQAVHFDLPQ